MLLNLTSRQLMYELAAALAPMVLTASVLANTAPAHKAWQTGVGRNRTTRGSAAAQAVNPD